MAKRAWYEELFDNYARRYDGESFTRGTAGECDFIEAEANHDRSVRILDVGCGTGRHAIELTRRGYPVTGIDLSPSQLQRAREKAAEAGLDIPFLVQDARNMTFEGAFDLVIMLCEGGFPLMDTDEENYRILGGAARALRPGGKFIFTTTNGLFPLFHSVDRFMEASTGPGDATYQSKGFDLMTFRDRSTIFMEDDDGRKKEIECNERYYVPSEITWLLKTLGFQRIDIYGARLGAFSRQDGLTTRDYEMLVIAQ
jgi:SAM-dependent methyltransferase